MCLLYTKSRICAYCQRENLYKIIDILSKIQPISIDALEIKGNRRNIAIIGGDCLTPQSWKIIGLSGDSDIARDRERERLRELLAGYENERFKLEANLGEKYVDLRSATPDQERVLKELDNMIKKIKDKLSNLT